jgi:hypothetical protein
VDTNTADTAAIVAISGTGVARKFFTCGRHPATGATLWRSRWHTSRPSRASWRGGERHCVAPHRRIQCYSTDAARHLVSKTGALALENLKC